MFVVLSTLSRLMRNNAINCKMNIHEVPDGWFPHPLVPAGCCPKCFYCRWVYSSPLWYILSSNTDVCLLTPSMSEYVCHSHSIAQTMASVPQQTDIQSEPLSNWLVPCEQMDLGPDGVCRRKWF